MKMKKMLVEKILPLVLFSLPFIALVISACTGPQKPDQKPDKAQPQSFVSHPDWSRNANIYEVNIRQFSLGGTLNEFIEHIPRLKEMGVDILWIMPVQPIGEKNRKGELGSYYSIRDYKAINPEFGTMDDFKSLVSQAHEAGMKVILDWVANHTSWDHAWITEHPEYYEKDSLGNIIAPYDWSDVAALDYGNPAVGVAMVCEMQFWIRETDIDGFRCDVAWDVPMEFWDMARAELDKMKPVFMLGEAEGPDYHARAFDMTYAWELHHLMNDMAKGKKKVGALDSLLIKQDTLFPADAYRMLFTSNHDENSYKGTEFERLGEASLCMAVLTATLPGMPLVYNGQESAFNERLRFFAKDTIDWKDYRLEPFYSSLFLLKHSYQPLWNGSWGGAMERIKTTADTSLFAFTRSKEGDRIFVITNLSGEVKEGKLKGDSFIGEYKEWFTGEEVNFDKGAKLRLKPWEYKVYVRK